MSEHSSAYVRAAIVVTAVAAVCAAGIQAIGLERINRVVAGVEWNGARIAVVESTLIGGLIVFQDIQDGVEHAATQIDTLSARVERLEDASQR